MEFIYDNILAIQSIKKYSLSIFEVDSPSSLKLLHQIDMLAYPWSTPRWTSEATVITMVDRRGLGGFLGLVIPHDTSRPPIIVDLGSYSTQLCLCILGTRLLVTGGRPHKVFRYGWDLDAPANQPSTLACVFEEEFSPILKFDEDTGRFLAYPLEWYLDIYDIIQYAISNFLSLYISNYRYCLSLISCSPHNRHLYNFVILRKYIF
jgi:hypothetical protein